MVRRRAISRHCDVPRLCAFRRNEWFDHWQDCHTNGKEEGDPRQEVEAEMIPQLLVQGEACATLHLLCMLPFFKKKSAVVVAGGGEKQTRF